MYSYFYIQINEERGGEREEERREREGGSVGGREGRVGRGGRNRVQDGRQWHYEEPLAPSSSQTPSVLVQR